MVRYQSKLILRDISPCHHNGHYTVQRIILLSNRVYAVSDTPGSSRFEWIPMSSFIGFPREERTAYGECMYCTPGISNISLTNRFHFGSGSESALTISRRYFYISIQILFWSLQFLFFHWPFLKIWFCSAGVKDVFFSVDCWNILVFEKCEKFNYTKRPI